MSKSAQDNETLVYAINCAQQGMAEDQPTFMILNEKTDEVARQHRPF